MKASKAWQGVRLRWVEAAADPDSAPIPVLLPTSWDDGAATALAAMRPMARRVSLPDLADGWIGLAAARAEAAGLFAATALAQKLHDLLLRRRGAVGAELWTDTAIAADRMPRFVLNLPAFLDPSTGFDLSGFQDAAALATITLALLRPDARRIAVGFADLDGLLAGLGLSYDSVAGRDVAACVAAVMRGHAEIASARLSSLTGLYALPDIWSAPPLHCVVAGLADAAARAFHDAAALPSCGHIAVAAQTPADAAEILLGVETTGLAPAFARVSVDGRLTRATRQMLAAQNLSPDQALAAMLRGEQPLPSASAEAHAAMHAALAPILPLVPLAQPRLGRLGLVQQGQPLSPRPVQPVELPMRRSGTMQKAAVGGHRVYLRTAEYEDGKLGEIGISLQKETPAFRALMDAFAASVSLGLQHGVPLEQFVETFVGTRFGVAGMVEGDPSVGAATSTLDYVFRHLAAAHLGQRLPEPDESEIAQLSSVVDFEPTLPLEWPQETPETRRRRLRLVS
ncbi:TSCPD domain-containing protein [Acidisoma cellulosilytica]|uniref:ribonucleoside-diphosphate reductase n=1 Tax=Acidisoma cellulosilyticum TaxID=2802395 RepID=A0A963Z0W1_9PROT|nr:TSCPD domain-containing protein [Acidisoma cellulosilyticum]MCB8880496.1 TSCPD domain-containing protein [Acidisoma cellulosilyticum]